MKKRIYLCRESELDIVKTFECGQCFRWNADEMGVYRGVFYGCAAKVYCENGGVYLESESHMDESTVREYFDLEHDYFVLSERFRVGDYMNKCVDFGRGIRILRQEPWEALCSFIISQCNNIPRIKNTVEKLCCLFGERTELDGRAFYTFPSAEKIAELQPEDLTPLRAGYRVPYIINAAKAVAAGETDLEMLKKLSFDESVLQLRKLNGVGAKVANCAALFGLGHMEAFPVDVWMKRALKEHFPEDFDPAVFGDYAGLAQQYIFFYARSGGE